MFAHYCSIPVAVGTNSTTTASIHDGTYKTLKWRKVLCPYHSGNSTF